MVYERRALGGRADGRPLFLLFVYELFPLGLLAAYFNSRRRISIRTRRRGDLVGLLGPLRLGRYFRTQLSRPVESRSVHGGPPGLLLRNVPRLFMQIDRFY